MPYFVYFIWFYSAIFIVNIHYWKFKNCLTEKWGLCLIKLLGLDLERTLVVASDFFFLGVYPENISKILQYILFIYSFVSGMEYC